MGKIRILDRMRQHHRAERRRIEIDRLVGAALQPREQIEIGRGEPGPHQLDLVRILVAERGGGGLGQPRRNADPHRAGDELQQRPAAGLVEFVEPARELFRQFGLAQCAQRGDDLGEGRRWRVVVEVCRSFRRHTCRPFTSPACGGGRIAPQRSCAAWRSGWGLFLGRCRGGLPPPQPLPPQAGEGASCA